MKIDDRFVGDTTPLVLWLSEKENGKEVPLKIASEVNWVKFKFKKGDVEKALVGINGTDDGRIEFRFDEDSVEEGEYVFNVQVEYSDDSKKTFDSDIMDVRGIIGA